MRRLKNLPSAFRLGLFIFWLLFDFAVGLTFMLLDLDSDADWFCFNLMTIIRVMEESWDAISGLLEIRSTSAAAAIPATSFKVRIIVGSVVWSDAM